MAFLDDNYLIGNETGLALFETVKGLPVIDAHNHADVAEIAANRKYNDPWQLCARRCASVPAGGSMIRPSGCAVSWNISAR